MVISAMASTAQVDWLTAWMGIVTALLFLVWRTMAAIQKTLDVVMYTLQASIEADIINQAVLDAGENTGRDERKDAGE